VFITGKRLSEPWLQRIPSSYTATFGPLKIPKSDYFMMGDNRIDSCDSRSWGPLPSSNIVGKVVALVWPLSRLHWF
jgi:signal peptidase I